MSVPSHPAEPASVTPARIGVGSASRINEPVCAECGKPVELTGALFEHVQPARHAVRIVMSKSQWDKWVQR